MSYVPSYTSRINWENEPSTASPINETNLNKMDYALYQHDQALQGQDGRISTLEGASKVTSFKGRTGAVVPADDDYTIAQIKATGTTGQVPTLNSQGKLEMQTPDAGGHVIEDNSGNVMPQQGTMQFNGSGVSVTNDATNGKTLVTINGGGGGGGGHTIQNPSGSSMNQRTNLQFTGSGVTVSDNSTDDKTVVNISSSGHTIKDGDGTAMTAQPNLQFVDAKVTNDAQGQVTKVQNFEDINWDDWQNVDDDDDTYYRVLNAPLADGTVEVDLMKKVWENDSPTSTFAQQNITLDDNNYDYYVVLAYVNNSIDRTISTMFKATDGCNIISVQGRAGGVESYNRAIVYTGSNSIYTISDAYYAIGTTATYGNNTLIIPYQILGIKKKVTISIDAIAKNVRARVDYSTEEKVIGTWIDGSTLYEKTIDFGYLPNTNIKYVAHNISNVSEFIHIEGICRTSTEWYPIPLGHPTSLAVNIFIGADDTNVFIRTGLDRSSVYAYVTIRYTKTT